MTETTNGEKIGRAVKGEFALGIQRIFIIIGIPIILGIGGFLGVRAVTSVDDLGKRVDVHAAKTQERISDLSSAVQVMQQAMQLRSASRDGQITEINGRVSDHETRIRVLERPGVH